MDYHTARQLRLYFSHEGLLSLVILYNAHGTAGDMAHPEEGRSAHLTRSFHLS